MSKITITSKEGITLTILEDPEIQDKKEQLYDNMSNEISKRFDEILTYLNLESSNEFSYENLIDQFDYCFLYEIIQIAVETALTSNSQYNIKENVLVALTEENLTEAITGEPMIEAFKDAINSLPTEDAYDRARLNCLIFNLETMNDEDNPFAFPGNYTESQELKSLRKYLKEDIDD